MPIRFAGTYQKVPKEIHYSVLSQIQLGFCHGGCFEIYHTKMNNWN